MDSIHQGRYAIYRKRGNLNRALEGIKKTVSLKKKLGSDTLLVLRMVAMRQNEHEMRSLRGLAREL